MATTAPAAALARQRKMAVLASSVGTVIEWYDYMVYAFVATTLAAVFFKKDEPGVALLSTLAVFGVSFLFRPLGGILFGHIADRFGRRPALTISVLGMALTSSLIGFLPTFEAVGLLAPLLLVALRALQGVAAGGEMASAAAYSAEGARHGRRGFDVSFVNLGLVVGTALGASVVGILVAVLGPEQMLAWGWRIPFWLSVPLGITAMLIRRQMEESNDFAALQESKTVKKSPLTAALRQAPGQVFLVTAMNLGSFAAYYIAFTYMSTYFKTQGIMSDGQALWSTVASLVAAGVSIPLWGRLSDRIGRKPVFLGSTALIAIVAYPIFLMMQQGFTFAIIGQVVFGILEGAYLGVLLAAYTEIFGPELRVSGVALGYNISSIIAGGPAPYVSQWLIQQTNIPEAPSFFLIAASAASFLATLLFYRETAFEHLQGTTQPIQTVQATASSERN